MSDLRLPSQPQPQGIAALGPVPVILPGDRYTRVCTTCLKLWMEQVDAKTVHESSTIFLSIR